MAVLTGKALLDAVIEATEATISELFQNALAQRLQDAIGAGITGNLALASVMGANAQIRAKIPEGQDPLGVLIGMVSNARQIIEDAPSELTPVDIDTGTLDTPAVFDAANGAYNFMDDAAVGGSVVINNVSDDDIISFSNADVSDYIFQHEDTDVTLSYNYNDEGIMNVIKLAGVVSSDDLVQDQASLSAALGFDVFGG